MTNSLLTFNIVDGQIVLVFSALSLAALIYLVVRREPRSLGGRRALRRRAAVRRVRTLIVAAGLGAIAAIVTLIITELGLNVFGTPLQSDTRYWVTGAFAAVGVAIVNLWRSRGWRRVIAATTIPLFLVTAMFGINAGYGLNPTLASLFNIDVGQRLTVPPQTAPTSQVPSEPAAPLWTTWKAPAGMPAKGQYGTVTIPNKASGFAARPAYLYLPPAALVPNPPALPILIMMMGQPGGPDQSSLFVQTVDSMAAANGGLAPIVLTIDQIGSPEKNPLCIDSPAGRVHTYVMSDVLDYIHVTLHVADGRQNWAIGGYSNGGTCALSFGAKHPDVFGSLLDISGEIEPSLGAESATLRNGFAGNQAAYDVEKPVNIMKAHHYTDMYAIFTSGEKDPTYTAEATTAEAAAKTAGMTTVRLTGPGVTHGADAVKFGFPTGLTLLYPRFGLQKPSS
ncbi:esterase [Cryobacterium algoricola]|uniref:Esterase n=1 Tax=Cryobacterium algoricola TaxID=1259183 RepID=A0ABY2ICU0_9MICO|nr:alpha/beta hydrolase-fold protein [Cryobacterium algoricola]TFB87414.1 esterase [Cryobacterium algoricola]